MPSEYYKLLNLQPNSLHALLASRSSSYVTSSAKHEKFRLTCFMHDVSRCPPPLPPLALGLPFDALPPRPPDFIEDVFSANKSSALLFFSYFGFPGEPLLLGSLSLPALLLPMFCRETARLLPRAENFVPVMQTTNLLFPFTRRSKSLKVATTRVALPHYTYHNYTYNTLEEGGNKNSAIKNKLNSVFQ